MLLRPDPEETGSRSQKKGGELEVRTRVINTHMPGRSWFPPDARTKAHKVSARRRPFAISCFSLPLFLTPVRLLQKHNKNPPRGIRRFPDRSRLPPEPRAPSLFRLPFAGSKRSWTWDGVPSPLVAREGSARKPPFAFRRWGRGAAAEGRLPLRAQAEQSPPGGSSLSTGFPFPAVSRPPRRGQAP